MMPNPGQRNAEIEQNMIPKIEEKRGSKLTKEELDKVKAADEAKKAAVTPVSKNLLSGSRK